MALRRGILSVLLLTVIADLALCADPIVNPCPQETVIDEPARECRSLTAKTDCGNEASCYGGSADGPGYCCRQVQVPQNVHCPIDNSKCKTLPKEDHCTTHSCPDGFKCCTKACGKRCVPAEGKLYGGSRRGR